MLRELKQKQIILENRKPYSTGVREYIRELSLLDWTYSSMRLDGGVLSRAETEKILKGGFIENVSISDHILIERYGDLFKAVNYMLEMSHNLNKEMILKFNQKLTGKSVNAYRRDNPVLVSLSHNPPHFSEIDEQIDLLMNWFFSEDMESDPVKKAACLHMRLLEIYPFEEFTEATARAAMYYYLMENGLPVFEIVLREQEYNTVVMEYLKKENLRPFCMELEEGLFNKMEVLIQLTAPKGGGS